MTNSYYLTQYRIDTESGYKQGMPEPEHTIFSEKEFTDLLRQYWPATASPYQFAKDSWRYILRRTNDEIPNGEINLHKNAISERHLTPIRWILLCIIFQRFAKRPVYLWNDSNLEDFLEITTSTTEHNILLWLDSR